MMKPDMSSVTMLIILSGLHGCSKALGKLLTGADFSQILQSLAGTAIIGTIVSWVVIWGLLRLFEKQHHTTLITNWILLAASLVSFTLAIIRMH
ncbi:hypothetical protein HBA93_10800 [Ochrobactrum sp. SFR4]|nr:hypothetical protein [Ochrobactrum sp. SFR4]